MNVMIINFCHRDFPINYGQTLLGYALYRNIQKLGHNPIMVSYTERNKDVQKWYLTRLLTPDRRSFASKSFAMTTTFIKHNMNFVPCFTKEDVYRVSDLCEAWVVGGDVVWRRGYLGEIFTLDFGSPSLRRISYSPSMYGYCDELEDFFSGELSKIKRNMDFVSFREGESCEIYRKLVGESAFHAIDPVMLETKEEWCEIAKPVEGIDKEFIIVYIMGSPEEYKSVIDEVTKENYDKQIVIIPTSEKWANLYDVTIPIGIEEFVWLFSNASSIITNSFHGTAFALEFEKQFFVCNRANMEGEGKDFRISELLKKVGIENRQYGNGDSKCIDYDEVRKKIKEWRIASKEYLKKSLSIETEKKYPIVYAAKNKSDDVREKSSSGGVFYSLALNVINDGGVVFGAEWNEDFEVQHTAVQSKEDLNRLCKSKYVQSYLGDTYKAVKEYLKEGRKVLFSGTPCQILGLRKYLNNQYSEHLLCVGIICHGTPKPEVWKSYLESLEQKYGKTKEVVFRDKTNGWKDWNIRIRFEDGEYFSKWKDDLYYKQFLENKSLLESCFGCNAKYHLNNIDILIGDYWRYESSMKDFDDDKGISAVVLFTKAGADLWEEVSNQFCLEKSNFGNLTSLQWHVEHSAIRP